MEAIEFSARRIKNNQIQIPQEYASMIKDEDKLRVIILIEHQNEENEFKNMAAEQFLKGYSDKDSIYDNL